MLHTIVILFLSLPKSDIFMASIQEHLFPSEKNDRINPMDKHLINDIFEWDVNNWSKAIEFWTDRIDVKNKQFDCLELGGRRGGLTLWLALNNNKVICSDLEVPKDPAKNLHTKYNCTDRVEYQSINATDIPFENKFDIVIFKSILGSISGNGKDILKKETIDQIYKCLKPNGKLLFEENLEGSVIHKSFRRAFVRWGRRWNYLKYSEIEEVFDSFEKLETQTVGFLRSLEERKNRGNYSVNLTALLNDSFP